MTRTNKIGQSTDLIPVKRSAATFLLLKTFSVYILVTFVITVGQIWFSYSDIRKFLIQDINVIMESELQQIHYGVWELDYLGLRANLEGTLKHRSIVGIQIFQPDGEPMLVGGKVVFEKSKIGYAEGIQFSDDANFSIQPAKMDPLDSLIEIKRKLSRDGFEIGEVIFYSSEFLVFDRLKASLVVIFITAGLKVAAMWIIFLYFSRLLIRQPLAQLSKAAAIIEIGQSEPTRAGLNHPRDDEIQFLEKSFDKMSSRLHHAFLNIKNLNQDLEEHKQELELKVLERTKELQIANKTKDKLFAVIAHDLRGPAGSLSTIFNDVIKEPSDIDQELWNSLKSSSRNHFNLLNQLLEWAMSQQGSLNMTFSNFSICDVIKNALDTLVVQAEQKRITLELEPCGDLFVFSDQCTVETVVRNLVSNALKFTPKEGKVLLSVTASEEKVMVEIIDSGVGISTEKCSDLFQSGKKVTSTRGTAEEQGSGFGLTLCAEFIEKNRGEIGVDSKLGEGSRFWFTLPKAKA